MNKKQKRTASGLILVGTSLASIAWQSATNVSADGSIFGSIKNFFTKSKSKTKDKVPLKLQKERVLDLEEGSIRMFSDRNVSKAFVMSAASITAATAALLLFSVSTIVRILAPAVMICSAAYTPMYCDLEAKRARANLKDKIKEKMLNEQYTLKEFEKIVEDDEKCSEFIRQLLVLERDIDVADEENYRLLGNSELEEAKVALQALFLKIDRVDKIKDLKNLSPENKEGLLKVLKPLLEWTLGDMRTFFQQEDRYYFDSQKDDEFISKVALLWNVLNDKIIRRTCSTADEFVAFINFICHDDRCEEKPYTKELVKRSFILDIKDNLKKSGVDVDLIEDSLLLDSASSLFKNLKYFDLLKFDDDKEDVRELAAKEFQSKFEKKELRDAVFKAIKRYLEEYVPGYKIQKYTNGDGKSESLKDRLEYVENYLLSQKKKDLSS